MSSYDKPPCDCQAPGFSVLLLYPDYLATQYGEETWFSYHSCASTPEEAIRFAQVEAMEATNSSVEMCDSSSDFLPLLVVRGNQEALMWDIGDG